MQGLGTSTSLPSIHKSRVIENAGSSRDYKQNGLSTVVLSFPDKKRADIQASIEAYHNKNR